MGQIDYYGHSFKWGTRKTANGFQAVCTINGFERIYGVHKHSMGAWRAAKTHAERWLEIYRDLVILQAADKRRERAFRKMVSKKLSAIKPAPHLPLRMLVKHNDRMAAYAGARYA